MKLEIYQVDAFADKTFEGNPAAVVPLSHWLDDDTLLKIAAENNLSETAFVVPNDTGYHLRWFTPVDEVPLCGHATLATAHVVFEVLNHDQGVIRFDSLSGPLYVRKQGQGYAMDFPASVPVPCAPPSDIIKALGITPVECLKSLYYLFRVENEQIIRDLSPNWAGLAEQTPWGFIVTAPGEQFDFVSRFFAPFHGVPEDPVTGSAHCVSAPYWAKELGKNTLHARQISKRGGNIICTYQNDRVELVGSACLYLKGEIYL